MANDDFFTILMHGRLMSALRRRPVRFRDAVQKTLEQLQFGYWDNGTRVKILQGVPKAVYEARVDRGSRLLFTVARSSSLLPPHAPERFLLVWDVVEHDAVDRRARRLNIQPETGFLDFRTVASAELEAPPAFAENPVEPTADWCEQLQRQPAAAMADDELRDAIRWFQLDADLVADEAEWQRLLDAADVRELELKLSLEQARAVFAPGPLLLRGTAGSGKTTVSVYRLARLVQEQPGARVVYATYSAALLNTVRQLFGDLYRARRIPAPERPPEFLTFPALYQRLAGMPETTRPVRFAAFDRWYRGVFGESDGALAWEEIRGIIKGACLELDREQLTRGEYEQLGRKRAPLFAAERPRLFKVYERYRDWLRSQQRYDDIDLARKAWRSLGDGARCDHVVCDEGQDLTELEMAFLLALCRSPQGLFFAADPQQIVNPSGFRWAEIRSLLRHRNRLVPEIWSLTRNYRSVHSVVALANALIRIQRERTGRSDDDALQETILQGASPVVVGGDEEAVLEQIRDFGPRCAVITASAESAERLGQRLASERVFSVADAKGLEFDGCVLWGILGDDRQLWSDILEGEAPLKEDPASRRALRHAYVAVTRARRYLGAYESDPAALALWQTADLRSHVEVDEPAGLARFMVTAASPEEWLEQGDYFLARGRYKQAAECFRRGGSAEREEAALARFHESVEEFGTAATLYRRLGRTEEQARCLVAAGRHGEAAELFAGAARWKEAGAAFEAAGQWRQAAQAWETAGEVEAMRRCRLEDLRKRRQWVDAARLCVKMGDRRAAIGFYQRAGRKDRVRELQLQEAEANQDQATMARIYEREGRLAEAAEAYEGAGDRDSACRCNAHRAEAAGRWQDAAEYWETIGHEERGLEMRVKAAGERQAWLEAAALHEKLGRPEAAAQCAVRDGSERGITWAAAIGAERDGDSLEAALLREKLGHFAAAEALIRRFQAPLTGWRDGSFGPDPGVELRSEQLRLRLIARGLAGQGQMEAALDLLDVRAHVRPSIRLAAEYAEQLKRWRLAADSYRRIDEHAEAARCYDQIGDVKRASVARAEVAMAEERYREAAALWRQGGHTRNVHKCEARVAEAEERYDDAAASYDAARMTAQARRCRQLAADHRQQLLPLDPPS